MSEIKSIENWICYECAAGIVNSGGRPLQTIWGANQTPHKEGQCSKCGKVETLCMYPKCYEPPATLCADCGHEIGKDCGPKDGWQLEDGRTVCHACCVADTRRLVRLVMRVINSPND